MVSAWRTRFHLQGLLDTVKPLHFCRHRSIAFRCTVGAYSSLDYGITHMLLEAVLTACDVTSITTRFGRRLQALAKQLPRAGRLPMSHQVVLPLIAIDRGKSRQGYQQSLGTCMMSSVHHTGRDLHLDDSLVHTCL